MSENIQFVTTIVVGTVLVVGIVVAGLIWHQAIKSKSEVKQKKLELETVGVMHGRQPAPPTLSNMLQQAQTNKLMQLQAQLDAERSAGVSRDSALLDLMGHNSGLGVAQINNGLDLSGLNNCINARKGL